MTTISPTTVGVGSGLARLADLIDRRSKDIEREWLVRVKRDVGISGLDLTELRDAMPEYLTRMAKSMRSNELGTSGAAAWREVAAHHGVTRVQQGFDPEQLIHEFAVLRQVIFELAEKEGVFRGLCREGQIADFIEAGMGESVRAFVQFRDYAARRKEAEHMAFMTHELRSPLNAAVLALSHLRGRVGTNTEIERPLEILQRNLERMTELLAEALEGARGGVPGEVVVERRQARLGDVLEPVITAAKLDANTKGLAFEARIDEDARVNVDSRLIASATQCLLENAVKYTEHGRVEITAEIRAQELVVHVRDSCGGIPQRRLRDLFEPYRRGRTDKPGTGLGLAIARRAIETQGGSIDVETTSGQGCHFWFRVPVVD